MSMVVGAVCFDSTWRPEQAADRLAQRSEGYPRLQTRSVHTDDRFALRMPHRRDHAATVPCTRHADGSLSWLLGDVNYFQNVSRFGSEEGHGSCPVSDEAVPGRWIEVTYSGSGEVRIRTDRLGLLWLYVARTPGGWLLSSDFGALARTLGSRLNVNDEALLCKFFLGYPSGNQTVFEEITVIPPASTIVLDPDGLRVSRSVNPVYGDAHAGLSRAAKFERLDELYDGIMRETIECSGSAITLSISAGNDSRYALGMLQRVGIEPKLLTFGNARSDEVRGAMAVCLRAGLENELFEIPGGTWEAWERIVAQLGSAGMVQWTGWVENWLECLRRQGSNVVIGYLGDALSGRHFVGPLDDVADWGQYWLGFARLDDWLSSPLMTRDARMRAREAVEKHVHEDCQGIDFAFPFQRAMHLDLYGRQRRWTAAQPHLLSRAVMPILPFYRASMIDFWSNLPFAEIRDQALYLDYARSRFPALFPPEPSRLAKLKTRAARKLQHVGNRLAGSEQAPKPPVIDRCEAIRPNRDSILSLAERVRPRVSHLFDLDAFCTRVRGFEGGSQSEAGLIIRATNLFQLVALAGDPSGSEPVAN